MLAHRKFRTLRALCHILQPKQRMRPTLHHTVTDQRANKLLTLNSFKKTFFLKKYMVTCAASNHEKYLITTWDFCAIKTSRVIRTLSQNHRTEEPCLTVWTWWRNTCQGKVRLSSAQPWPRWKVELSGRLSTCHLRFFLKKFHAHVTHNCYRPALVNFQADW